MKTLLAVVLALTFLSPAVAFADAATDAALGLGAFAVFNQILGGVGIFGYHPAPVVVAPRVTERVVVHEHHHYPPPRRVHHYYYPAPAYHYGPPTVIVRERGWCPPGRARKGWC